ncbi:hypothetical protein WN55_05908 [Dufourea novaeangliae]|uniref:Uncharacterized protein n=1 Tax=Dufourea novaeangliae TaxID=178035 RepID=A0A154PMT2_DUFNO|nr:hypothetical protein WN55_05908 [Dufourea novaeangliae]
MCMGVLSPIPFLRFTRLKLLLARDTSRLTDENVLNGPVDHAALRHTTDTICTCEYEKRQEGGGETEEEARGSSVEDGETAWRPLLGGYTCSTAAIPSATTTESPSRGHHTSNSCWPALLVFARCFARTHFVLLFIQLPIS